jgi:DNA primase
MSFAEQLKSQVDIVRTVGEYVRLRKIGARYSGLCPFHTEKTPSFSVNPTLGIFICFGCGKKGDVLKFVQEMEQLTFPETLKLLAERNGIPMPERRERSDPHSDLRQAIFEMHDVATAAFRENLFSAAAGDVRQYLATRGLNQTVAEQFAIGYSDRSGQDLMKRFRGRFSSEAMEASGLFGKREDGTFYDYFRGRLMFPIHNESGKVIAFGGRALRADEKAKYINSPETAIYKKSNTLYNLHRAKESIRKSDRVVLVEGYMDVIGVYAAGIRHVVASCGTSLTEEQVRAMKRHSQHAVVNFDPDNAGANATERSIEMLLKEGMHVRILTLEGGLDPDEYIKEHGAGVYMSNLEKATGYFIWLADRARRKHDMNSAEGRFDGFKAVLLPAIRRISDRLERAAVATEVADYLGIDRNTVLNEFRRVPTGREGTVAAKRSENAPNIERILLRSIVSDREVRNILIPAIRASAAARRFSIWPILEVISELTEDGDDCTFTVIESRLSETMQALLSGALFADSSDEIFSLEQAASYVRVLNMEDQKLQVESLRARLKEAERSGSTSEAFRLIEELNRLQRSRKA